MLCDKLKKIPQIKGIFKYIVNNICSYYLSRFLVKIAISTKPDTATKT